MAHTNTSHKTFRNRAELTHRHCRRTTLRRQRYLRGWYESGDLNQWSAREHETKMAPVFFFDDIKRERIVANNLATILHQWECLKLQVLTSGKEVPLWQLFFG